PLRSDVVGFAFCWQEGEAWYVPVRAPEGARALDPAETLARLRPTLEDAGGAKGNQNIKYDLLAPRRQGADAAGGGTPPPGRGWRPDGRGLPLACRRAQP